MRESGRSHISLILAIAGAIEAGLVSSVAIFSPDGAERVVETFKEVFNPIVGIIVLVLIAVLFIAQVIIGTIIGIRQNKHHEPTDDTRTLLIGVFAVGVFVSIILSIVFIGSL